MSEDVCVFCGCQDRGLKTDHLREVYKEAQDRLARSQYHPRLFWTELDKLQLGPNSVCSNMKKCRARRTKAWINSLAQTTTV